MDCKEGRQMGLHDDCHVRIVDQWHRLILLRYLHPSSGISLESLSDQMHVSYIRKENEELLSASQIVILRRHKKSLSTLFRHGPRLIYLVHCEMTYAVRFKLEYDVQMLQAGAYDKASDMQLPQLIQDASLSMCCCYTRFAKLFIKSTAC